MRSVLSIAAFMLLVAPVATADLTSAQIDTATEEIIGPWKMDFTTPDGVQRTPMVVIGRQHRELVGWYIEKDEPEPFKTVKLNDETLVLTIRPKEHSDIMVTFEATLETSGVCVGEGTYTSDDGDSGSWRIRGERLSPSAFDESDKWQLSFVAPDDQQHKAVVTVVSKNDRLYGWYSSKDFELPATKFAIDGDQVVMSVTAKTEDGTPIDVTFRGTVSGDRVSGTAEYDLSGETGSFSFSGQRKS